MVLNKSMLKDKESKTTVEATVSSEKKNKNTGRTKQHQYLKTR
jgi:hypothetical protein